MGMALAQIPQQFVVLGAVVLGIICFVLFIMLFKYGWLYIRAAVSGAHVNFLTLIAMRLRRVDPVQIGRASCRERCRSRWSPYH